MKPQLLNLKCYTVCLLNPGCGTTECNIHFTQARSCDEQGQKSQYKQKQVHDPYNHEFY